MKARLKTNGEIVEVEDLYDDGTALVKDRYFKVSELDFEDFKTIDWEQRRYELAKAAMSGILSGQNIFYCTCSESKNEIDGKKSSPIAIAKYAIACADCLIKILKDNK